MDSANEDDPLRGHDGFLPARSPRGTVFALRFTESQPGLLRTSNRGIYYTFAPVGMAMVFLFIGIYALATASPREPIEPTLNLALEFAAIAAVPGLYGLWQWRKHDRLIVDVDRLVVQFVHRGMWSTRTREYPIDGPSLAIVPCVLEDSGLEKSKGYGVAIVTTNPKDRLLLAASKKKEKIEAYMDELPSVLKPALMREQSWLVQVSATGLCIACTPEA